MFKPSEIYYEKDIEKAFELKSMDALKMLDGQFNSPFYKE